MSYKMEQLEETKGLKLICQAAQMTQCQVKSYCENLERSVLESLKKEIECTLNVCFKQFLENTNNQFEDRIEKYISNRQGHKKMNSAVFNNLPATNVGDDGFPLTFLARFYKNHTDLKKEWKDQEVGSKSVIIAKDLLKNSARLVALAVKHCPLLCECRYENIIPQIKKTKHYQSNNLSYSGLTLC
jgi:hypothetical protein